eukprot:6240285-Pyramimonas_sp.AAC.1
MIYPDQRIRGSSTAKSPLNLKRASTETWRSMGNWQTHRHKATTPEKRQKPNHHTKADDSHYLGGVGSGP